MCLFPACDGLGEIAGDEFCFEYCENSPETWLDETADLGCDEFVERLYSLGNWRNSAATNLPLMNVAKFVNSRLGAASQATDALVSAEI